MSLVLLWVFVTACGQATQNTPPPRPQFTFTPLPTGSLTIHTLPQPSGDDPLPALLAEIQGPADGSIVDMFLDGEANRLYILDGSAQLHVLDADTYVDLATIRLDPQLVEPWLLDFWPRRFTQDTTHDRLYLSLGDVAVLVLDTASLTELGVLTPGGPVAVDPARNRFYAGTQHYWDRDAPDVRVYDGATLEKLDEIPRTGVVGYNPARDEICILGPDRIHLVDAANLKSSGELCVYEDCIGEGYFLPTWVGRQATDLHVFAERNLLAVEYTGFRAGKGGSIGLPRFFEATTLEEVTDLVRTAYEFRCDRSLALVEPLNGRLYQGPRDDSWIPYGQYETLVVYDLQGRPLIPVPGIPLGVINPATGQLYSPYIEDQMRIVDLESLTPRSVLPVSCLYALDAGSGRIFGRSAGSLLVFSERGGSPKLPGSTTGLDRETITRIQLSPDYAQDRTLFLSTYGDNLYRSTDGGQTWVKLAGGLPDYRGVASLSLAISPDFANDRTLFVAGDHYFGQAHLSGEGVYRSTDGGDTWQPMWQGLTNLFIREVNISPNFAEDDTVSANIDRIMFRSTDRGQNWTFVAEGTFNPPTGGQAFCPDLKQRHNCLSLHFGQGFLSAPVNSDPPASYVLAPCNVYRSLDDGLTWQRWVDERLAQFSCSGTLDRMMTAGAISPLLNDGSYQIFVGTGDGQFWVLDPDEMDWLPADL
jgi:hypothetical protein